MSDETGTELVSHRASLMEDLFFAAKDAARIREYRSKIAAQERKTELRQVAPFDQQTLDGLVEAGIDKHTIMAAKLIPLITVAWSDGKMEENEAKAILRAAHAKGMQEGSTAHKLLEGWLKVEPNDELFATWKGFISGYAMSYDVSALQKEIVGLSEEIAETAGGVLRFLAVSKDEKTVIDDIKAAFRST
jgi:hypothetical protein